jgi:ATP-dependent Clp protease ATP-binding subunit ClpC
MMNCAMHAAFTATLRQAINHAQQQARQLNQEFVGSEHLMLGLLATDPCEAVRALSRQDLNPRQLHSALLAKLRHGKQPPVISGDLPLSPKAQRIINIAIVMAQSMRQPAISTRMLLLALLDESDTLLTQVLRDGGADSDSLASQLSAKPEELET